MDNTANYIYYNGELYHAQKRQHKYIARVKMSNGKYRYFYTREEYNAYRKSKESPEPKKTSKFESVSKFFKKIKNNISKLLKKSKKELGESIEKGHKFVEENGEWLGGLVAVDKLFKLTMHFIPLEHNPSAYAKATQNIKYF